MLVLKLDCLLLIGLSVVTESRCPLSIQMECIRKNIHSVERMNVGMKVMFIVDSISRGGAGRVVCTLVDKFSIIGTEVIVVAMAQSEDNEGRYLKGQDIKVVFFPRLFRNSDISPIQKLRKLRALLKSNRPDIVIAFLNEYGEYAVLASLGLKTKVIISERIDPSKSPTNKILRLLRNPLYALSSKLVFQTDEMKAFFPKYIQKKGVVIPNPVTDSLQESFDGVREKRIVSVGRLTSQKNHSMAINAFSRFVKRFPDFIYEIYGEGPLRQSIEKQIQDLGLTESVRLMGHVPNVTERIRTASAFVLASNYEGMSNALVEAMALGIPCISTDHPIGGARMLIQSGVNGFLVPIDDAEKLADTMINLLDDMSLCESISMQSRKIRDKLSSDRIAAIWLNVCQDVLR